MSLSGVGWGGGVGFGKPEGDIGLHPIGLTRLTALVNAAGFSDPAIFFQALDVQGFLLQRQDGGSGTAGAGTGEDR